MDVEVEKACLVEGVLAGTRAAVVREAQAAAVEAGAEKGKADRVHAESYKVMKQVMAERLAGKPNLHVLDVGSMDVQKGKQPTYRMLMEPTWKYTGSDLASGPNVDIVQPGPYKLEFLDGCFDAVISGNCIEHVEYPARLIVEMVRVLKPGGLLIVGAPYMMREHRFPQDCWRFLPDGMLVLFRDAGLTEIQTWKNEIDCWGVGIKGA